MNVIWSVILVLSLAMLMFSSPEQALLSLTAGGSKTVEFGLRLFGVYCVWLGVINMAEKCGIIGWLNKTLGPLVNFLFGGVSQKAKQYVVLNLAANLIGVSNAATPSAIKAVEEMDDGSEELNKATAMLFVINATGLQLLSTTILGLRSAAGSAQPTAVIVPTLVSSAISTVLAVILITLAYKNKEKTCRPT